MANSVNGITHPFWRKLGSIPMGYTKKKINYAHVGEGDPLTQKTFALIT